MSQTARNALIAGGVVLLHVAALWALQAGLLRRAAEIIVPVELISALLTPPAAPAPPVPQPAAAEPVQQPVVRKTQPVPAPAPRPVAAPDPTPSPAAPTATSEPQPAAPSVTTPMSAAPTAAPAPAPAARVEMPITDADYLQNPPPAYPRMSFRLGEEGTSVIRVLIGPDGRALDAQVAKSSGYARLDQAAEATARSWRYVPGKRGGVPEAMWVNVPIKWEIKKN